jgi:hypothetical protein
MTIKHTTHSDHLDPTYAQGNSPMQCKSTTVKKNNSMWLKEMGHSSNMTRS